MSSEDKEPYETQSNASKAEYARMKLLTPAERIMVLAAQAMHHPVRCIFACMHFCLHAFLPACIWPAYMHTQFIVTSPRLQDASVPACIHISALCQYSKAARCV